MFKTILAAAAATLIIATTALPANAALTLNGYLWNGLGLNGLGLNALTLNGLSFNGLSFNGLSFNGIEMPPQQNFTIEAIELPEQR